MIFSLYDELLSFRSFSTCLYVSRLVLIIDSSLLIDWLSQSKKMSLFQLFLISVLMPKISTVSQKESPLIGKTLRIYVSEVSALIFTKNRLSDCCSKDKLSRVLSTRYLQSTKSTPCSKWSRCIILTR